MKYYIKIYQEESPIKSILIMIYTIGALLFLFYFIHIDFIPTLNIADISYLLIVMALLGLFFLLFFSAIFVAPAILWEKIHPDILKLNLNTNMKNVSQNIFIYHLTVASAFFFSLIYINKVSRSDFFLIALLLMILNSLPFLKYFYDEKIKGWSNFFLMFSYGAMVILLFAFSFLIFLTIIKDAPLLHSKDQFDSIVFSIMGAATIPITNLLFLDKSLKRWRYIVPSLAVLFLSFFIVKNLGFLSSNILRILHLGNFTAQTITLQSKECRFLKKSYPKQIQIESDDTCRIQKPFVASRIGQELLLKIEDKYFTIRTQDILSYTWE